MVIVKYGNVQVLFKIIFNQEAFRGFDILEIDATERGSEVLGRVHELCRVWSIYTDVYGLDASKLVEEDSFALHNWLGGECSNISKA